MLLGEGPKTLQETIERLEYARVHTQSWYARHYGKLQDWARTRLPEPWRTEFFNCVANGSFSPVLDRHYFRVDNAAGQLIFDLTARAEGAEARVRELGELIRVLTQSTP